MAVRWALAALLAGLAAPTAGEDAVRLEIDRQPGRYRIAAVYDGAVHDGLEYRLQVVREGSAGRSRTAQSGVVRGDTLSAVSVGVAAGDRVVARVTVRGAGGVKSEAVLDETVGR